MGKDLRQVLIAVRRGKDFKVRSTFKDAEVVITSLPNGRCKIKTFLYEVELSAANVVRVLHELLRTPFGETLFHLTTPKGRYPLNPSGHWYPTK